MDAFQQNWTERIKTDMFVNKVLNSEDRFQKTHIRYRRRPKPDKRYKTYKSKWSQKMEDRVHRNITKDALKQKHYRLYDENIGYNYISTEEKSLMANSRPQSLYNLHYASIR